MRQIGDTIYTINEIHQSVSKWKILEINDEVYRCQNKRTEKIREFSERDAIIFDTREEAGNSIRKRRNKKNIVIVLGFLFVVLIAVAIILLQILGGNF